MAEENLESFLEGDPDTDGEEDEEERRQRLVIFGQIDLTIKAGLAHHWSVKLVECPHDPHCRFENGEAETEAEAEVSPDTNQCLNAEGDWYEVDGFQMDDMTHLKNNSINGSDDYTTPGEYRGVKSRLTSAPECIVGVTQRTDREIFIFNKDYLARNPKYSLLRNNCQNYADQFCDFLCKSSGVLGACGIVLENVKDAMAKAYENMPEGLKEAVMAAEAAAADEDSTLHDVMEFGTSGFAKLRSFKQDFKSKWKNKFGSGTAV